MSEHKLCQKEKRVSMILSRDPIVDIIHVSTRRHLTFHPFLDCESLSHINDRVFYGEDVERIAESIIKV